MHKIFVYTYLFHITPARFDIEVLSPGSCSYAKVSQLNTTDYFMWVLKLKYYNIKTS